MADAPAPSRSASSENDRRDRHRSLCEASRIALASPEFRQVLDDLKARCEAATVKATASRQDDISFDSGRERTEGWAFERIGNVFA